MAPSTSPGGFRPLEVPVRDQTTLPGFKPIEVAPRTVPADTPTKNRRGRTPSTTTHEAAPSADKPKES